MTFAEFYDFLFDNAFFHLPLIEAVGAIFLAMSLGAALVGLWGKMSGRGQTSAAEQIRKAA